MTVGRATPTITWTKPASIIYGTSLSSTQLDAAASVPGSFVYGPALGTVLHAGSNQTLTMTFTPNDTTDYNNVTTTVQINVTPAPLTITANNQSKVYGAPLPALTAGYSGFVNGDTAASLTTRPTLSTTATASSHVAGNSYSITASGAVDPDYSISYVAGTLTVTPAPLTITANNDSKTYGTLKTFSGTAFTETGLVTANGDTITGVTETSTGAAVSAAVGTDPVVPVAAAGTGLSNYTIVYVNGTLTVNAAPLTVTADNESKTYGQSLTFAGTEFTTGTLYNGDTVRGVTLTSPGASGSASVSGSPYAIVPSAAVGSGLGNYTISYVAGKLAVNEAALTVTADNESKTYGTPDDLQPARSSRKPDLVTANGDTVTGVTDDQHRGGGVGGGVGHRTTPSFPAPRRAAGLSNYTIGYVNGKLTVNAAPLTVTANNESKT